MSPNGQAGLLHICHSVPSSVDTTRSTADYTVGPEPSRQDTPVPGTLSDPDGAGPSMRDRSSRASPFQRTGGQRHEAHVGPNERLVTGLHPAARGRTVVGEQGARCQGLLEVHLDRLEDCRSSVLGCGQGGQSHLGSSSSSPTNHVGACVGWEPGKTMAADGRRGARGRPIHSAASIRRPGLLLELATAASRALARLDLASEEGPRWLSRPGACRPGRRGVAGTMAATTGPARARWTGSVFRSCCPILVP